MQDYSKILQSTEAMNFYEFLLPYNVGMIVGLVIKAEERPHFAEIEASLTYNFRLCIFR